jgi:signal transduction histidine kinase
VITDRHGRVLSALGSGQPPATSLTSALTNREATGFAHLPQEVVQVVTVPIGIGPGASELLGTLSVGLALDDALAQQLEAATESDVVFLQDGEIRASTLAGLNSADLARAFDTRPLATTYVGSEEFLALRRPLGDAADAPQAVILRSRTERLRVLRPLRTAFVAALVLAVMLAVGLSYGVARTVTRPLTAITATMRTTAATGDLGHTLDLQGTWHDEDTRTLAQTFNGLLASLARFQREASRRQRLAALGRLATVVAHEIRNPLMVIQSALPVLGSPSATSAELSQVAKDIASEVKRMDRIVGDVLDFTREVKVERQPTDLMEVAQAACDAALAPHGTPFSIIRDAPLPEVSTDGERVRQLLIALLTNAREALNGSSSGIVELRLALGAPGRVVVDVADCGPGFSETDLPHVFEPYFTTRRTGTGLGLAIARNVSEALGGTLSASNRPQGGALLRLELPVDPEVRT